MFAKNYLAKDSMGFFTRGEEHMSQTKHIPLRQCVVCREAGTQKELLRLSQKEGQWQFDLRRKAGGRGAWLCLKPQCHEVKSLKRFFRQDAERIAREVSVIKHALGNILPPSTEVKGAQQGRNLGGMNVR
jgi:uncharacterized protein